ncbi:MAG: hypothetical protein AAGI72_03900 [Pseudomonadota bacterium]
MICVETRSFQQQIEVLKHLASDRALMVCAWLYPESELQSIAGFDTDLVPVGLQPVTTYGDNHQPRHTTLCIASNDAFEAFSDAESEVRANCDCLALYTEGESSWYASAIGHEGMCLLNTEATPSALRNAGFTISNEAPPWW